MTDSVSSSAARQRAICSLCDQPCQWVFAGAGDSFMWACGAHVADVLASFDNERVWVHDARND